MDKAIQVVAKQQILGNEFTVYGTVEEPLVLAKDVATWIDNPNTSQMVQTVDEDEKLVYTLYISGQNRDCLFLTENGVYEVLMQSRKPIAKAFKKEVKRILHELRVNGISVTKSFASLDVDKQIQKCLQACAVATNQIEMLTKANVILVNERDDALATVEEQKEHILKIDEQRLDMVDSVATFTPVYDKPGENYIPVRGCYRPKHNKVEQDDVTKTQNAYKSMVRNAISKQCMTDLQLEDLKTVIKADEIKGNKHTKDEIKLIDLYNEGRIGIKATLL